MCRDDRFWRKNRIILFQTAQYFQPVRHVHNLWGFEEIRFEVMRVTSDWAMIQSGPEPVSWVLYSLYSLLEFLYEVGIGSWRLTSQQLARLSNILFGSCFAFCQLTRAWSGSPGSVEWYGQGITQVQGTGVTWDKGPWVLVQSGEARLFWCVMEWTAYGDCWGH